jgi:hypothetical protein
MTPEEQKYRRIYDDIATKITSTLGVPAPATSWVTLWLTRHSYHSILAAIEVLQGHPEHIRARYSTESVGKAISALLRAEAVRRAALRDPGVKA